MQGWIEGFQKSIDFMEQNMTEELDTADIAAQAALSPFYYQRIFGALCGMTVGEYIRARRMTLAAQELSREDVKVIDVAIKYGYESPDSFAKAFQKFHGITPSQAREAGAPLRSFAPLHIKITMEGGTMLDYRIVEKAPFTIVGTRRRRSSGLNTWDREKSVLSWELLAFALTWAVKILTIGSRICISRGKTSRKAVRLIRFPEVYGLSSSVKERCRTACSV